ncbi:hypothetical protein NQ314_006679, partial [Rhamnusium bicolor]
SSAYAYIAERGWQVDTAVINAGLDPTKCRDIAHQLVKWDTGKKFNVILGGGANYFYLTVLQIH